MAGRIRRAGGTVAGLGGPIFAREVLTASRKGRLYFLRFIYVLVLLGYTVLVWTSVTHPGGEKGFQVSRMFQAGVSIVNCVAWFQFFAMQTAMVLLLCTSISSEQDRRTLDALLPSPLSGRQIILGKILAAMLSLTPLLAVSLPVLTLVLVFGGVPWVSVFAAVTCTLVGMFVSGMVTVCLSAHIRYVPSMLVAGLPMGVGAAFIVGSSMVFYTSEIPPHGGWVMLLLAQLSACVCLTWKLGMTVFGHWLDDYRGRQAGYLPTRPGFPPQVNAAQAVPPDHEYKAIEGSPVVWHVLRRGLWRDRRSHWLVGIVLTVLAVCLFIAELLMGVGKPQFLAFVLNSLLIVAAARLAIDAAGAINSSRQSGTWEILLATPLSDWGIVRGHLWGTLVRARRTLILLAAFPSFCALIGRLHPGGVMAWAALLAGALALAAGVGLHAGVMQRRMSRAGLATLSLLTGLWLVLPYLLDLLGRVVPLRQMPVIGQYDCVSPIRLTAMLPVVFDGRGGTAGMWPFFGECFCFGACGLAVGGLLLWRAKRHLRQILS